MFGLGQPKPPGQDLPDDRMLSDEGRMLKKMLIDRTDSIRKVIDTYQQEYAYQIDAAKSAMSTIVNDRIDATKLLVEEAQKKADKSFMVARTAMSHEFRLFREQILKKIEDQTSDAEKKINILTTSVGKMVDDQSARRFADILATVKEIKDSVAVSDAGFNKSLSAYQTETRDQLRLLKKDLSDTLGRIRGILKYIS